MLEEELGKSVKCIGIGTTGLKVLDAFPYYFFPNIVGRNRDVHIGDVNHPEICHGGGSRNCYLPNLGGSLYTIIRTETKLRIVLVTGAFVQVLGNPLPIEH